MVIMNSEEVERKILLVLRILHNSGEPLGARLIARLMEEHGVFLSERTVRYHLQLMDERGLTRLVGRHDGRVITEAGIDEISHARVKDKVGFAISRIENLAFQTSLNLDTREGAVPVNVSFFQEDTFDDVLTAMKPAFQSRLFVSDRAHMVMPFHRLIDEYREQDRSRGEKIGTTKRGIGPCYGDKASRVGLRMGDLLDPSLAEVLDQKLAEQNRILEALGAPPQDVSAVKAQYLEAAAFLGPHIADTVTLLNRAIDSKESVLFEGAQGTMLDIDFGTYPFVTSSNATAGGACTGSGVAPHRIDQVIGVVKAYTTRVGEGPFPTELLDDTGRILRETGHEFGATTGRPRRCGWFDAVVARYSVMINGIDFWAMTKMDVLDPFETIRICVAYECDGRRYDAVPASVRVLERCRPVYEDFKGWKCSTRDVTRFEDLPSQAKAYVARIEQITGVPVGILSVGPRRDSTMRLAPSLGSGKN